MNQSIKLTLVGDVFLSNMDYTRGFGVGSRLIKDGINIINPETIKVLKDTDILFGNLESPFINDIELVDSGCFAGSTRFTTILREFDFDIVSIANNHILEQGFDGFISTRNALTDAQIKYVGVFDNHKSNIEIIERKGLKFGFAAFNAIKDIPNPNLHADLTFENVKATLDEMVLLNIDYKLLSFHWGNEYINIPSYAQIKLAHSIIDYGADVIIGHHPHVVQPVEKYKHGIIVYSLGNFIFDSLFSKEFKTGLKVDIYISTNKSINYSIYEVKLNEVNLNSIVNSHYFVVKLAKYNSIMSSLVVSKKKYDSYYRRILFINNYYQRFMMKIKLLKMIRNPLTRKNIMIVVRKKILTYR